MKMVVVHDSRRGGEGVHRSTVVATVWRLWWMTDVVMKVMRGDGGVDDGSGWEVMVWWVLVDDVCGDDDMEMKVGGGVAYTQGQIKVLHPRTAEEILARERERKARTTLLMALPKDHLAKFHKMIDAKEMWDAIKSIFGRNDESKKMFQSLLSQLEIHGAGVSTENANQKFLRISSFLHGSSFLYFMGTKPGVDSLSFDDLYNNLRVFENDVKGSTASSSSTQNVAFVSKNTSSTNDVSTAYSVSNPSGQSSQYEQNSSYSLLTNQSSCPQLDHEDLEQLDEFDLEKMDLKWQIGQSSEEEEDYALMACNSSGSDTEVNSCSNECKESYAKLKKLYDAQREQLSDANIEIKAYTQGLKKVEAQLVAHQQGQLWYEEKIRFMKIDLDDKTDVLTYHKKLLAEAQKEKEDLKAKVEKWNNSSKNLGKLLNTQMSANDKFGLGYGDHRYDGILSYENEVLQSVFMNKESELEKQPLYDSFVTARGMHASQPNESETQTSDFDTCESECSVQTHESLPEPTVIELKVVVQPKIWSDAPIIEEYESDSEDEHVSQPTKNWNNLVFAYFSHLIRDCDFHEKRMAKQAELNNSMKMKSSQKVNTARASVSAVGGKRETVVKTSAGCNWRQKGHYWQNISKYNSGSTLKHKGIIDSGCSRNMTGNKAYLAAYQDFNGGFVTFGGSKGYITGKGDSEKEDESAQDYFVLPIWSSYSSTVKRSTAKDASEAPNKDPNLKTYEKPVDKEDQVFFDELKRLKRQEQDANDAAEALRKEFA
ncbi:hypothetical protein Tco_1065238 [Tanacetum coccineum]